MRAFSLGILTHDEKVYQVLALTASFCGDTIFLLDHANIQELKVIAKSTYCGRVIFYGKSLRFHLLQLLGPAFFSIFLRCSFHVGVGFGGSCTFSFRDCGAASDIKVVRVLGLLLGKVKHKNIIQLYSHFS